MVNEQVSSVKSFQNQKIIFVVLLVLLGLGVLAAVGIGAFRLGKSQLGIAPPVEEPTITPTPTPEITPTPTLTPTDTLKPTTPANPAKSDADKIRQVLANKYDRTIEETEINVSKNTGTHATGSVRFAGEMGGGMWLAYKEGENWIIAYDGQGTIPCSAVDPYNFPTDIVPECWDETTSSLITR